MRHTRKAFTLIELLVVIGIVLVLLGLLLPFVNKSRREARLPACMKNQNQVFNALKVFTQNNSDVCPGSCGPIAGPGPGTNYVGVGQLTSCSDALSQAILEKTNRSLLVMNGYLPGTAAFHCPEQDNQLPLELAICNSPANFQYVFNAWFVGDLKCQPPSLANPLAKYYPVYSGGHFPNISLQQLQNPGYGAVTLNRVRNPSRCVIITEDGKLTDYSLPSTVNGVTYLHATPWHNQRAHKSTDPPGPYSSADGAICTFVDGHAELMVVDMVANDQQLYTVPSDHSGLPQP
jgi:prepilin-type N-terminal cleavage/methylation domain-containing protein